MLVGAGCDGTVPNKLLAWTAADHLFLELGRAQASCNPASLCLTGVTFVSLQDRGFSPDFRNVNLMFA